MQITLASLYTILVWAIGFLWFFARVVRKVTSYKKDLDAVRDQVVENWAHTITLEASIWSIQKQLNDNQMNYQVRLAQVETDLQWIKSVLIRIDKKLP